MNYCESKRALPSPMSSNLRHDTLKVLPRADYWLRLGEHAYELNCMPSQCRLNSRTQSSAQTCCLLPPFGTDDLSSRTRTMSLQH
jgi:hypothetical protein